MEVVAKGNGWTSQLLAKNIGDIPFSASIFDCKKVQNLRKMTFHSLIDLIDLLTPRLLGVYYFLSLTLLTPRLLGVYYFLSLTLSVCLYVCLFVCL